MPPTSLSLGEGKRKEDERDGGTEDDESDEVQLVDERPDALDDGGVGAVLALPDAPARQRSEAPAAT